MSTIDKELDILVKNERLRQMEGLELIASENFTSKNVMHFLGSCLTNKYSEGLPGKRYYGGNQYIDQIENICNSRALKAFGLDPEVWSCNCQALSGTSANFAVYTALLQPGDKLMGLHLPSGGHLSHGYETPNKKISAVSVYFSSHPYYLHPETHLIDYERLAEDALQLKPKLIIAGASAYSRDWDYERMRKIADSVGAYLMADIAHISGLVAAGVQKSPFPFCDVVTTTTHKTLRGPRGALIFAQNHLIDSINFAVFPMLNGGPHNHQIAAIAAALEEVCHPEFKKYAEQIIKNSRCLAQFLIHRGNKIQTGGTDNHLFLWNLQDYGISGSKMERVCEMCNITVNKNTVFGDKSAFSPGGVRIGTAALTTRGMVENEMLEVGKFLLEASEICKDAQRTCVEKFGDKKLKNFITILKEPSNIASRIELLKQKVCAFAMNFTMPGL
jgi:glycine hydroxymethyltransferase